MRFFLALILLSFSLSSVQAQVNDKDPSAMPPEINFERAPFWLISYDEFRNLKANQKSYYLDNVGPEIRKVPGLEDIAQDKISEGMEWSQDWNKIMRKVYQACLNKTLAKECKNVASVRLKAIGLAGNDKLENRNAGLEASPSTKSSAPKAKQTKASEKEPKKAK